MRLISLAILALALCLPASAQTSIDSVVAQYGYSVPKVRGTNGGGRYSTGSGVYIGNQWVLSAKHVTENTSRIQCIFGRTRAIDVRDWVYSKNSDQVLMKLVRDPGVPAVRLVRQTSADEVIGAGFDRGSRLRFWSGPPSGSYNSGTRSFAGHGGAISGNSGGPIFNTSGGLIGNLHSTNGRECFFTGNDTTLAFIRRAALRYPELGQLLPDDQQNNQQIGGISSPAPAQPQFICQPGQQCVPVQPGTATPEAATPGTVTPPIVVTPPTAASPGAAQIRIQPRVLPQINGGGVIPFDIPIQITIEPSISLGQVSPQ